MTLLNTRGLVFQYPEKTIQFPDIHCTRGEVLLINGQSGSGKSTLMHLLAGLLRPHLGTIDVGETRITRLSAGQLDRFRGLHIGIVFQQPHFLGSLSVLDNLLAAAAFSKSGKQKKDALLLLEKLAIADQAHKKPSRLSAGQQQRVSIARSLMNDPVLILADEPTASLDDNNCGAVARLLQEQATESRAALLIVTHDQRLTSLFQHIVSL